jgi:hypothetical protein
MDGIFVNDMSRTGDTSGDPNLPRIYNTPATDCNVLNLEVLEKRVGVRPEFLSQCTCAREARAGLVHLQIGPQLEPRGKIKVSDLYHRFEDEAQTCIGSQGWRIQQGSLDRPAHRPHSVGESVFLWISSFSPGWNAGHCAFSLLRLLPPASEEKRGALSSFRLRWSGFGPR